MRNPILVITPRPKSNRIQMAARQAQPSSQRAPSAGGGDGEEDAGDGTQAAVGDGNGESEPPNPMILMQNIQEKLKLLDYEIKFAREQMDGFVTHPGAPLLNQVYFANPHPKPNEQFYYFVSLFAWLMGLNRFKFPRPEQYDDPNTTVSNIVEALRRARISTNYPLVKVKQGYGEAVCVILDQLCDGALENTGVRVADKIAYPADNYPEEAPVDEDEVSADIADTIQTEHEEDDDVYSVGLADASNMKKEADAKEQKILEASVDPHAWRVEVESVGPLLKMRIEADNKEWRTHLEMTKELQGNILQKVPTAKEQLTKLGSTIGAAVDSISTREKYINSQYKTLIQEYHEMQERLHECSKKYDESTAAVSDRTNDLARISEELEAIKGQMDERGESMTDTGPLVKLKDAMKKVKKEIKDMDVRIGSGSHNLLHLKLQHMHQRAEDKLHHSRADPDDD